VVSPKIEYELPKTLLALQLDVIQCMIGSIVLYLDTTSNYFLPEVLEVVRPKLSALTVAIREARINAKP